MNPQQQLPNGSLPDSPTPTATTVILARWVVPVQGDSVHPGPIVCNGDDEIVISHGAVAMKGSRIVAVGKASDVVRDLQNEKVEIVDLSKNHLVIPGGFVG